MNTKPNIDEILESEYNFKFALLAQKAMITSFFKYGPVKENYPHNVDAIASLKKRLALYEATGNTEYLVDVSNFASIEFTYPKHPKAYYSATASKDSPGVVGYTVKEHERGREIEKLGLIKR